MIDGAVDFEDRLVPVVALAGELYLFSTSDGAVYRVGKSLTSHFRSLPPQTFAVPGDASTYSVSLSAATVVVERRHLAGLEREVTSLGRAGFHIPVAVIAGGTDRYVVLRLRGEQSAVFVSLSTGTRRRLRLPNGACPLFMTSTGQVVYQDGEVWGASGPSGPAEPGVVTSWHDAGTPASVANAVGTWPHLTGGRSGRPSCIAMEF